MIVQSNSRLIDWSAKGKERIAQNVQNLINTFRYEVAYHRTMGIPVDIIDSPTPESMATLEVEVRSLLARYEPRANVQNVLVTTDNNGKLQIEVELK